MFEDFFYNLIVLNLQINNPDSSEPQGREERISVLLCPGIPSGFEEWWKQVAG